MYKQRLVTGAILFLSVIAFGAAVALSQVVLTKLDALRESSHDNILWSLQRLELEAVNLENSAKSGATSSPSLSLQDNFDIFVSRVATIVEAPQFAPLRDRPQFQITLQQLSDILDRLIDRTDQSNLATAPDFNQTLADIESIRQLANSLSLDGLTGITIKTVNDRSELYRTMRNLGLVSLGLVLLLGTFGVYVTGREREANQLAALRKDLLAAMQTVINTSLDAIVIINQKGKLVEFNPAAERIFGYSRTSLLGQDITKYLVPEKYQKAHQSGIMHAVRNQNYRLVGKGRVHMQALRASGEEFAMEMAIERIGTHDQTQFVAFIRDTSVGYGQDINAADHRTLESRDLKAISILIDGLGQSVTRDSRDNLQLWLEQDLADLGDLISVISGATKPNPITFALDRLLDDIVTYINAISGSAAKQTVLEWDHLPIRMVTGQRAILRAIVKLVFHQIMVQLPNAALAIVVQELAYMGNSHLIELRLIVEEDASNRHQILSELLFGNQTDGAQRLICPTFAKLVALMGAEINLKPINQQQSVIALKLPLHKL